MWEYDKPFKKVCLREESGEEIECFQGVEQARSGIRKYVNQGSCTIDFSWDPAFYYPNTIIWDIPEHEGILLVVAFNEEWGSGRACGGYFIKGYPGSRCSEPKPECPSCCQDGEWVPKTDFGQCNLPRANGKNEWVCKKNPFDGHFNWVPEVVKPGRPCSLPNWSPSYVKEVPSYYSFEKACVSHDQCYGSCPGKGILSRKDCDDVFLAEMINSCKNFPRLEKKQDCIFWARQFYEIIKNKGRESFDGRRSCCHKKPPKCFLD